MISDIKNAKKLYSQCKYDESLELFEKAYDENPDIFKLNDLISFCWAIYQVHVKNFIDENILFDSVEFITDLIPQADLNSVSTCPYTFSVVAVMDHLYKNKEYYNLFYWIEKLNPKLLDDIKSNYKGRSRREKYYDYLSKSYLECAEWKECIEISNEALKVLDKFSYDGDTWHHWRIAKSLRELKQYKDALTHLNEVVKVKNDWFIFKEFVENYYLLGENEKALEYVCGAVLTDDPVKSKVNLYYLIYKILNESNPDIAFKHAELYYLLKLDSNAEIAEDIEDLFIDEDELDKESLISQINDFWFDFKFKNQELQYGTVSKYFDDRNFGFIIDDNDESIFFHNNEFKGDNVYAGQLVSFYTEKSFDKSKNKESLKAICIRGE